MTKLTALLCLALSACIFTLDEDGDGPPVGSPYCGDSIVSATEQCDDGNSIADDGCTLCRRDTGTAHVTASWTFKNIATNTTTGCPSGYDTVALYNQEIDDGGTAIGSPIIDLFDCAAGTGTSAPLPAIELLSWIEVVDHNNTSKYASSTWGWVDLTVSDKSFFAQILNDGGYFELAWSLVGAASGSPLTCTEAAAAGVELVATDVASSTNTASDLFPCEEGYGITAGFRAATYTVNVTALNASDQPVGSAPALLNKVIGDRNAITHVGTLAIAITGL